MSGSKSDLSDLRHKTISSISASWKPQKASENCSKPGDAIFFVHIVIWILKADLKYVNMFGRREKPSSVLWLENLPPKDSPTRHFSWCWYWWVCFTRKIRQPQNWFLLVLVPVWSVISCSPGNDLLRILTQNNQNYQADKHRCKKCFTFWEGVWTLRNFCQKNSVFAWVHRTFWIYKTRYSDHFDICRWKVFIFLDFALYSNILQSKYWIYAYFPNTFSHLP